MGYTGKAPHPSHGRLESYIHRGVAVGVYMVMTYSIFKVSEDVLKQRKFLNIRFSKGNPWIGRLKDALDINWYMVEDSLFNPLWKWLLGHAIVNYVLIKIGCRQARKYFFPLLTFAFLMTILGPKVTTLVLVQSTLMSLVAYATGSHLCVWVVSVTCIAFLSVKKLRNVMEYYFPFSLSYDEEYYIRENLLPMNMLRSTDVALFILEYRGSKSNEEITYRSSKNSENENEFSHSRERTSVSWRLWVDIISYILYFPLASFGPFMTFKEFLTQLNRQLTADDNEISGKGEKKLMKSGLWIIIYEVSLHYFYINTILHNGDILSTTNLWAMMGAGYLNAQTFMVRYFIKWSITSGFAHLDYIDTVPPPACPYRVFRYTDLWKSFNSGFYEFNKTHIYVPLGGSRFGWRRQILAMLPVFGFVFVWHGCKKSFAVWVSCNVLATILELFAGRFTLHLASSQRFKLSPTCLRRINTLIHVPIHLLCTVGIFIFLGGMKSTSIIVQRMVFEGFPMSVVCSVIVSYCIIQTSKDYDIYVHNKSFRRQNVEK